ncbi:MAG: type I-C CRISPR-associated protein Cas7/Csd2 [Candidatus Dormibacteraceae bacterium]
MNEIHIDPKKRHDFKLIFDVTDGNPNGDPDAGNLPRVDPETMQGLVTDVSIKRKVRNYVDAVKGPAGAPWRIYVQNRGAALNTLHQQAYDAKEIRSTGSKQKRVDVDNARAWMCEQFFDVRTFGAVMTTGVNCGQVRGPVQITMARSVDPIVPLELSITRVAITRQKDTEVVEGESGEGSGGKVTEMGRKSFVPYGVYVAVGSVSPIFAAQTGFSTDDLAVLWESLVHMWDLDRSSARGLMSCRGLHIFTHESNIGNAPSHVLLDRVNVTRYDGVKPPRHFSDYAVVVSSDPLPEGVTAATLP